MKSVEKLIMWQNSEIWDLGATFDFVVSMSFWENLTHLQFSGNMTSERFFSTHMIHFQPTFLYLFSATFHTKFFPRI